MLLDRLLVLVALGLSLPHEKSSDGGTLAAGVALPLTLLVSESEESCRVVGGRV